jgi:hypothetical protein
MINKKHISGLFAFLPIIILFISIPTFNHLEAIGIYDAYKEITFFEIFVYFFIALVWGIVGMFIYINWRSTYITKADKIWWTTILVAFNMFATPFYWYSNIWKIKSEQENT